MRVKNYKDIRNRYKFQAPMFPADVQTGKKLELTDTVKVLDLNEFLVPEPDRYFLVRVSGESMIEEQIFDGDILVVDRQGFPINGKIVISALNGEMTVKTLKQIDGEIYLYSANKKFLPIKIFHYMDFQIQGVVKHVIHNL